MKKSSLAIALLGTALVASNIAWAVHAFDVGISRAYERASYDSGADALARAIAVIPVVADGRSSKGAILAAAHRSGDSVDVYEKEGVMWVGSLGLGFDGTGKVTKACAVACPE